MLKQLIGASALAFGAAAIMASPAAADDPAYSGTAVKSVTATLVDSTGAAAGTVQLHQDAAGVVLVRVDAIGLPEGAHGIHIHAVGKCEGPAFTSAGGHFNPTGAKHGLDNPAGPHSGDLVQIPADFTGTGTYTATTDRISLTTGASNIFDADGSALMIHATADDQVTDPTGNSGARIACAVIADASASAVPTPRPPQTGSGQASPDRNNAVLWGTLLVVATGALGSAVIMRKRALRIRA